MKTVKIKRGREIKADFTHLVLTIPINSNQMDKYVVFLHLREVPTRELINFLRKEVATDEDVFVYFLDNEYKGELEVDRFDHLPLDTKMIYELVGQQTLGNYFWIDLININPVYQGEIEIEF